MLAPSAAAVLARLRRLGFAAALAVAFALCACNLGDSVGLPVNGDSGRLDAEAIDGQGDAPSSEGLLEDSSAADGDGGDRDVSGPSTQVVRESTVTLDRLCDIDGDGELDNAIADLGEPHAGVLARVLSSTLGSTAADDTRLVLHFPLVDDRAAPNDSSTRAVVFFGVDEDIPRDPSNDFDGDAVFGVRRTSLDDCGEPLYYFSDVSIDEGRVEMGQGRLVAVIDAEHPTEERKEFVVDVTEASGTAAPWLGEVDLDLCGAIRIHEIGGVPVTDAGISGLEMLLAGGAAFGVSSVPGVEPDLDFDGDGLERFVTDDDSRIVSCVDGDETDIAGADCWRDPRMADGFSINLRVSMVPAVLGEREGWWNPDCAPDPSLWDHW